MSTQTDRELAERAGVEPSYVEQLREQGILTTPAGEAFQVGDLRRIRVVERLEAAGLPLPVIGDAIRRGSLSLDFVEQPAYERFAANADVTFQELSEREHVPLELLLVVREAMGFPVPDPHDRLRENELRVLPFLKIVLAAGISPAAIEKTLRVSGDGLRRVAETEADWWRSEILEPLFRSAVDPAEIGTRTERFARDVGGVTDEALLAIYHGQQGHAWMRNIFEGFEGLLARAGLHQRLERPPAICFFDVTGYTRLTEERGDAEAADLASRVARAVARPSTERGGKVIKWLGDGIMFHFREPGGAVLAALEMLDVVTAEGLPQGHVGIHAGPVLFQEGDYFGRTVNVAARIADRAARGQVLVSQEVVDTSAAAAVSFESIGAVELKGLLEPIELFAARRDA